MYQLPKFLRIAGFAVGCVSATTALSADLTPAFVPAAPAFVQNDWKFQASLYGWATALNGSVGVRGLPPSNVNVTFAEILQDLNGALMGSFGGSNGTWMFLTDLVWAKLSDSVVGPFGGQASFELKQTIASGIIGYRLPIGPASLNISATAGVRFNSLKTQIDINPALIPLGASRSATKQWADPIIGLSARYEIDDRWFVSGLADIGGFGVASKITAQGFGAVGYRWSPMVSSSLGYRVIYTDYQDGGFVYRTTQHGLLTSLNIHF